MNRRRLVVALALMSLVTLFVAAKIATRWRPVKVADWKAPPGANVGSSLDVSQRYISGHGWLLDLQSGRKQATHTLLVGPDAWTRQWRPAPRIKDRVVLKHAGQEVVFQLPSPLIAVNDYLQVRVSPQRACAEALYTQGFTQWDKPHRLVYCRWNLTSRRIEAKRAFAESGGGFYSLSQNAPNMTRTTSRPPLSLSVVSPSDGRTLRRVVWPKFGSSNLIWRLSRSRYIIVGDSSKPTAMPMRVMDARTGRELYRFRQTGLNAPLFFSPDEKILCVAVAARHQWELRDAQSGALLRALPLVPDAVAGEFSPDGATLYSVAGGVLYRQRAR